MAKQVGKRNDAVIVTAENLNDIVRATRKELGMSQRELEDAAELPLSTVSKLERNVIKDVASSERVNAVIKFFNDNGYNYTFESQPLRDEYIDEKCEGVSHDSILETADIQTGIYTKTVLDHPVKKVYDTSLPVNTELREFNKTISKEGSPANVTLNSELAVAEKYIDFSEICDAVLVGVFKEISQPFFEARETDIDDMINKHLISEIKNVLVSNDKEILNDLTETIGIIIRYIRPDMVLQDNVNITAMNIKTIANTLKINK